MELRAVVALAFRLHVRPSDVLEMSEAEFLLCLAHAKLESEERDRTR